MSITYDVFSNTTLNMKGLVAIKTTELKAFKDNGSLSEEDTIKIKDMPLDIKDLFELLSTNRQQLTLTKYISNLYLESYCDNEKSEEKTKNVHKRYSNLKVLGNAIENLKLFSTLNLPYEDNKDLSKIFIKQILSMSKSLDIPKGYVMNSIYNMLVKNNKEIKEVLYKHLEPGLLLKLTSSDRFMLVGREKKEDLLIKNNLFYMAAGEGDFETLSYLLSKNKLSELNILHTENLSEKGFFEKIKIKKDDKIYDIREDLVDYKIESIINLESCVLMMFTLKKESDIQGEDLLKYKQMFEKTGFVFTEEKEACLLVNALNNKSANLFKEWNWEAFNSFPLKKLVEHSFINNSLSKDNRTLLKDKAVVVQNLLNGMDDIEFKNIMKNTIKNTHIENNFFRNIEERENYDKVIGMIFEPIYFLLSLLEPKKKESFIQLLDETFTDTINNIFKNKELSKKEAELLTIKYEERFLSVILNTPKSTTLRKRI